MVAPLRFLQHCKVVIEFLFRFECGAVHPLQLGILFVALVVRARDIGELECTDVSRAHHVRPRAKINEIAAAIE